MRSTLGTRPLGPTTRQLLPPAKRAFRLKCARRAWIGSTSALAVHTCLRSGNSSPGERVGTNDTTRTDRASDASVSSATSAPRRPKPRSGPCPHARSSSIDPLMLGLAIGVTALIIGLLRWLYLRRRSQAPVSITPKDAALAEINAANSLAKDDLSFVTPQWRSPTISHFNVKSGPNDDTSEELISKLPVTNESKSHLRDFFEKCDSVKFAQASLTDSEKEEILGAAHALVNTLRKRLEHEFLPIPRPALLRLLVLLPYSLGGKVAWAPKPPFASSTSLAKAAASSRSRAGKLLFAARRGPRRTDRRISAPTNGAH